MPIRSISASITAAAVLFFSAVCSAPCSASASTAPPAAAVHLEGATIVRGAGKMRPSGSQAWSDAVSGDVLTAGVTVQASPGEPLEMTMPDGVTIALDPGALVQWAAATKLPGEMNRFVRGYHLLLQDGELEVRMPPGPKGEHAFLVETRAGTLTDWRGQLHIMVKGDTAAAAIYEGALVVGTNGQGFPVHDGAGIFIRKGGNPEKSRGIPASPTWEPGHAAISFASLTSQSTPAPLDLAWGPVPGAASYRVEIATDPTMVHVVGRSSAAEPHEAAIDPAAGGRYFARVRAVDARGIVGVWSPVRPLRVVRYALPDGAFVSSDGAVVIPADATVRLLDADGLQFAYEGIASPSRAPASLYWADAGGPLRLPEDAPARIVHFRDPVLTGAGDTASDADRGSGRLLLARSKLHADVELAPKTARWPNDAIDARVILRDPSGRVSGATAPVTLEALLDLTPLPVDWQRHGDTWTGRIAPRPIAAPSVVRVRVLDEKGSEIGRGFVEIGNR